jgi:hypothetical protein
MGCRFSSCSGKVVIPENKPFIFVRGNGKGRTTISHESASIDNAESTAFIVNGDNVIVFGISFRVRAPLIFPTSVSIIFPRFLFLLQRQRIPEG